MSCSRGKASPDRHTQLRLFAASAGYCQRPGCRRPLFVDTPSKNIHIAEMAHVFAANDDGPRAKPEMTPEERGAFKNLILLCSACHTEVDKAPEDFPDTMLLGWKEKHATAVAELFGAAEYSSRQEARDALEAALSENRAIFEAYGPNGDYRFDPESELADVWRRKVVTKVLPNNRKVLAILDANRRHLSSTEHHTLERFRHHVDDLEARHLGEGIQAVGQRFPSDMATILTDIAK